jgi:riboflavin kinase/FMN adenylyltransferase
MRHLTSLKEINLERSYLTIGSFDGIHVGHQAILRDLVSQAREVDIPAVVLTFFPHPSVVLHGRTPSFYIMTPEEKSRALFAQGIDIVISENFNAEIARVTAADFLNMLESRLGMKRVYAGENFTFGYGRQGNQKYLEEQSQIRGFEFVPIPPVHIDGEVVSSTRVRESLRIGDVERVSRYLGRYFEIPGIVSRGVGRGRKLGFPTANLAIWDQRAFPAPGVYACWSKLGGERIPSVVNIGIRPTFEEAVDGPVIEAHLLDFERDLYGFELILHFVDRLRDEQKFPNPAALLNQIEQDIQAAKSVLSQS